MSSRKTSLTVGLLFIAGTLAGIGSLVLAGQHIHSPDYLVRLSENRASIQWGGILILFMGVSLSLIPVTLFPVFRKNHEPLALGAVIFRGALEMGAYMGIVCSWWLLLFVSVNYGSSGVNEAAMWKISGELVMELGKKASLMLDLVFSIGALFIYTLFIKTKLIPLWLSLWGLVGGVLYLVFPLLVLFGISLEYLQAPLGIQEMVMAGWLLIKGFDPQAWEVLHAKAE